MTRFVVTGTGRSGTSWITEVLRRTGLNAGHEEVYAFEALRPWGDWDGDASFMAVPYLEMGAPTDDLRIVHLVRHPSRVIASIYEVGLGWVPGDNPPMRAWLPDLCAQTDADALGHEEHFERLCAIWCRMIDAAETHARATFRIEDLADVTEARRFMDAIGHPDRDVAPFASVGPLNHQGDTRRQPQRRRWRTPHGTFEWSALPLAVRARASALGYKEGR